MPRSDNMKLNPGSHIHLMGICGTAMGSLAGILKTMGYRVSGSDQNVYPPMSTQLESLGIEIMQGYKKENLHPHPDLVVVGNVISSHFEEAEELMRLDLPYTSLPSAMGEYVIKDRNSVVVAGTHGKTTTTSMLAQVAEDCGKNPGFLVGGIPLNFNQSFRKPDGDWFIIEGDEYDTAFFDKVPKFIHYKPKFVILSSIEFDHADIYNSVEEIKDAFKMLLQRVPEDGVVVYNAEDDNIKAILSVAKCKCVSYGVDAGDYRAVDRQAIVGRNQFAVEYKGDRQADIAIKAFGKHNTLNALASYALAIEMGWPVHLVLQGLASFKGVKRRQEVIGEPNGITIVEDFAHHPTAVELTLGCMREAYGDRRLIALFEPRSATARRNTFHNEYLKAFQEADVIIYPKAFDQTNIPESERFSSQQFIEDLKSQGKQAYFFEGTNEIVDFLKKECRPEDVLLIMSNGGFDGIYQKLIDGLG